MDRLIEALLEFARVGSSPLQLCALDLETVLDRADAAVDRGATFHFSLSRAA